MSPKSTEGPISNVPVGFCRICELFRVSKESASTCRGDLFRDLSSVRRFLFPMGCRNASGLCSEGVRTSPVSPHTVMCRAGSLRSLHGVLPYMHLRQHLILWPNLLLCDSLWRPRNNQLLLVLYDSWWRPCNNQSFLWCFVTDCGDLVTNRASSVSAVSA